jgi:hypothetical protein
VIVERWVETPFTVEVRERYPQLLVVASGNVRAGTHRFPGARGYGPQEMLECSETPSFADIAAPETESPTRGLN